MSAVASLPSSPAERIPRVLRILLLAPQPFFEVRGTPMAVRAMAEALAAMGHEVDLLTYPQGQDVVLPGIRHLRSPWLPVGRIRPGFSLSKMALDVPFILEAGARLIGKRYDVVHAVEEAAHLIAPLARRLGVALVVDLDSSIPEQLAHARMPGRGLLIRLVRRLERDAWRVAAAAITICQSLTDAVRETAPQTAVFQIEDPPLVDGDQLPGPQEAAALRSELSLGPGAVVLYAGNFEPYQGVELLVDAAALVPEAEMVFIGGEAGEVTALEKRAADRGCAQRCRFVGKRPPSELPRFLALADVLVSPRCRGGNIPFKVYTYLASGKPLVATDIPTHTQLLDASLAKLVAPTPEGIAAGIRDVLTDTLKAVERSVRGRALIAREYGVERFSAKVRLAYGHVAAGLKPA